MPIIASCGHTLSESEGMGISLAIKGQSKDGSRCIRYIVACQKCATRYMADGQVLETKQDEYNYLNHNQ